MYDILYNIILLPTELINIIYDYSIDIYRLNEKIFKFKEEIKKIEKIKDSYYDKLSLFPFNNDNFNNFRFYINEIVYIDFDIVIDKIFYITLIKNKLFDQIKKKLLLKMMITMMVVIFF